MQGKDLIANLEFLNEPVICPGVTSDTKGLFAVCAIATLGGGEPSGLYLHKNGTWHDRADSQHAYDGYFASAALAQKAIAVSAAARDGLRHPCYVAAGRDIWAVCRDVAKWRGSAH